MILRELFEAKAKAKSVGIIFGRFNPPHMGHIKAWEMASENPAWYVGTNKDTQGPKDPLPFNVKIEVMKAMYPSIDGHLVAETSWLTLASKVYEKHGNIVLNVYTDEDWVTKTLVQYNGKEGAHGYYEFGAIQQQATPRLSSATALRAAVQADDRDAFSKAAGVDADTLIAGHAFFDVVKHYLMPYVAKAAAKPVKKKVKEPVAEGVTEMDKSSPQPGRDGRVSHSTYGSRDKGGSKGSEREAKPITAKKAAQDALNILKKQGVAEGSLNEFAPAGFNGSDDGEEFNPRLAKMAYDEGVVKGVSLADGATLERAMAINDWDKHDGGIYKQHFAKGFKAGRMNKINHDNKQYNLNLKLMKDGSIRHGEQGVAEGSSGDELNARPGAWRGDAKRMTSKGKPTQDELGMQDNLKNRIKSSNKKGGLTGPKGVLPEEQDVAEGGPFGYGAKKPRQGSVADLAAKKRKEQDKNYKPTEPKDQMVGTAKVKQGVAEGLPQTLRKVVPGYAKREIDQKMDAGKFGKTDADKDANFQRYKKIQDKLKEQDVAENAWDRLQREKALESAGVGIITKQNSTVDVNKNTPKKNLKAFRLI